MKLSRLAVGALLLGNVLPLSGLWGQSATTTPSASAEDAQTDAPAAESGPMQYTVILRAPSLAAAYADARAQGRTMSDGEQQAYVAQLRAAQDQILSRIAAEGGSEITRAGKSLNALFIVADAALATRIAGFDGVRSVQAVVDLQTHAEPVQFKEVSPWVGSSSLRAAGLDGTGVRVAVLDSGIDYTHAAFGGAGTAEAYYRAYGLSQLAEENKSPVAWPQGRVIGGTDFVGERWPNGPLAPDPNPIAAPPPGNDLGIVGTDGSHGTSVADILAGGPFAGRPDNFGIAPGASLYAVKVCSAVSTSCSGVAMVQGIEWALDPNGDDSLSDAVDVINMSLGGNFGQRENPVAEAAANAVRAGVVICAAAGNAGDNPYIISSPANSPEVLAVAQTSMPNGKVFKVRIATSGGQSLVFQVTNSLAWAPIAGSTTAALVIPSSTMLCNLPSPDAFAGKVVLVDRGNCDISYKVAYAQSAGAAAVLVVNNISGEPPTFSYGGVPFDLPENFAINIPALVLSQADGNTLKSLVASGQAIDVTLSDQDFTATSMTVASTSSRGPGYTTNLLKPEIAAPGASLAAVSGSGTGFAIFGGTSGATPVVSGAAALLRQRFPGLDPLEVKARLMNQAQPDVWVNPISAPGVLASLSRVGAGEVRAGSAAGAEAVAWAVGANGAASLPSLSFGYWRLSGLQTFTQTVRVKNTSSNSRTFSIAVQNRAAPGLGGAVVVSVPGSISVPAGGWADFPVSMVIDPSKLPNWSTDSGQYGADGARLAGLEYTGFVTISDATDTLRLPWHVLPQRAHRGLVSSSNYQLGAGSPLLTNAPSSLAATASVYALTGTSPRLPAGTYPAPGDNFAVTDLQNVGVRLVDFGPPFGLGLEFAITTWDRHTHANYPAQFQIVIDTNNDGQADWFIFNQRISSTTPDWRNATFVQGATWTVAYGTFFTTTDFNSANIILQVPLNRIGQNVPYIPSPNPVVDPISATQPFTFTVQAFDNYFTGLLTDQVGPMTYTPAWPKYVINGTLGNVSAAPGGSAALPITSTQTDFSPSQNGLLLMFQNGRTRYESQVIKVTP